MNAFPRTSGVAALAFSLLAVVFLGAGARAGAEPVGTAFTYQGRLLDGVDAASGPHEFAFQIYGVETGGTNLGPTLLQVVPSMPNGLFTVKLDFGFSVFTGEKRWLEIQLRPAGSLDPFTVLAPRVELTATPHAIRDGGGLRTVIVRPGGASTTANGDILRAAVEGITTASATERWVVKLEPGIFNLGTTPLDVPSFVDLEGSGDEATVVTSAVDSTTEGTLNLAGQSELRSLAVSNLGGGTGTHVAVVVSGASNGLSRADFFASGGANAYAVLCIGSSPTINGCTVIATGASGNNAAVANDSDSHPNCYNSYLGSDDSVVRQLDAASSALVKDCTFGGTIVAADRVELYGAVDSDGAVISDRQWTVGPHPDGAAASGTRLLNVLASITDASAATPAIIRLLPGTFDVGDTQLALKEGVRVVGAGRDQTTLTSTGLAQVQGVVTSAVDAELADLTISATTSPVQVRGVEVAGGELRLRGVVVEATTLGSNIPATAIQLSGGILDAEDCRFIASAQNQDAVGLFCNSADVRTSVLSRCGFSISGSPGMSGYGVHAVVSSVLQVRDSNITLTGGMTGYGARIAGTARLEMIGSSIDSNFVGIVADTTTLPVEIRDCAITATLAMDQIGVVAPRAAGCMLDGLIGPLVVKVNCYDGNFVAIP